MTSEPIIESEMTFGPYQDGYCFYIEKSNTYRAIQDGVQISEFLLIRSNQNEISNVWVVEAKKSSPKPGNSTDFDEFIDEIKEKLANGLTLGIAACLLRHKSAENELPSQFRQLNLSESSFRLVLVIKGHQESWLPPLQDALKKALCATVKTWALPATAVSVINDSMARKEGLIQ